MPARYVETREAVDPATLQPYPGNAKLHDRDALTESVTVNGQFRSVLARVLPDGGLQLLAGHGTTEAVAGVGSPVRVEVVEADDEEARRIVLADNAVGARAGYDEQALLALLDKAQADGGLGGTGYDDDLYAELLDRVGSENPHDWQAPVVDPDEQDLEPPEEPVTQLGDLWELGAHRLVCGDGTHPEVLLQAVQGRPVRVVHCDPPYGVSIVNDTGKVGHHTGTPFRGIAKGDGRVIKTTVYAPVIGDETTDTAARSFAVLTEAYPQARHVWWGANYYTASGSLPDATCWLIWDKQTDGNTVADAELAWTNRPGVVRMFRHMWSGMMRASERGKRVHPTQKPVALIAWTIDTADPDGDGLVLDTFGGSGSTLLAAEQLGRPAAVIELAPAYCDVIARRWAELTGGTPLRNGEPVDLIRENAHA